MKKFATKTLALLMVLLTLISIAPVSSYAESVYLYETIEADVKSWSRPASSSTDPQSKWKKIEQKGTVLKVVSKVKNNKSNPPTYWYKYISGKNSSGEYVYRYVYVENVKKHTHKYKGGKCTSTGCGYTHPLIDETSISMSVKVTSDEAKIHPQPYDVYSEVRTEQKGTILKVVAKAYNVDSNGKKNNLWFKLEDGNWVYSDRVKQCHIVKYNANGGNGAPSSQNFLSGSTLTLSTTKPTRVGYTFQGWSTSSSASSVSYAAGAKYSTKKSVTLYAVWKECTHSNYNDRGICTKCKYEFVLKDAGSYSGTYVVNKNNVPIRSAPYKNEKNVVDYVNSNTKLTFKRAVTNAHGNKWFQLENGNWIYSDNVAKRYSVKYSANGGKGAPSTQYFLSGKTVTLSTTKPTRAGYIFKGWATSKDSTKVSYNPGSKYSTKKDITLYAVWAKCSHTYTGGICTKCKYEYPLTVTEFNATFVVSNDNGAPGRLKPYENSTKKDTYKYKDILKVVAKTYNIDSKGNKHNLWYKLDDGNWVYSGNVTQRFAVKYNANGGTGKPSTQYFLSGKEVKISSTKPTKDGYVFKGWATSKDSTKVSYNPGATYSTKKDITLYAVWTKCSHTYTGGICTKCKYEYPLTVTTFNGTFVVTNADGAIIRNTPYDVSGSKIIKYAKNKVLTVVAKTTNSSGDLWYKLSDGNWVSSKNVKQRFTVKYNANGGENAPSTQYFLIDKSVKIRTSIPSRWGYEFKGWSTSATSSKVAYKSGATYSKKQDVTLYAVWEKCGYTSTKIFKNSTSAFNVPGLADDFVPQGLCYIEAMGVYAISGYVKEQVSRIYLVNAQTGSVKRINLKDFTSHAGGIASNGTDVWVSSGGNENKGGYVYHTTVNALEKVANNGTLKFDGKFQTLVKGSALYCSDDTLWVCEFYKKKDYPVNASHAYGNNHAWACGYDLPVDVDYSASKLLLPDKILSIPDKVQGMCITDDGDIIFSTSHGRFYDSELIVYSDLSSWKRTTTTVSGRKIPLYSAKSSNLIAKIEMPTLMEGLDFHNGKMYVIFESGAKAYSNAKEVISHAWETNIKNVLKAYK